VLKTQQMIFILFPATFVLSYIIKHKEGHKFFYYGFIFFSFLYLSQAGGRLFKILGFGTLSILSLWLIVFIKYHQLKFAASYPAN
ncbi:MAG: hypothetical protein JW994_00535, partial [Candidatus Omnitrophica bacterium]|nr:hypothetical protein [Candidatus Omnitrophota bacterium]